MERILCTNGTREDFFDTIAVGNPRFTEKTGFWIKKVVEAPKSKPAKVEAPKVEPTTLYETL